MTSNRILVTTVVCLCFALASTGCGTTAPMSPSLVSSDGVEVQSILTEVQKALDVSAIRLKDLPVPPLESVTLTLQASVARDLGGKIGCLIIAFGHSVQSETTQEMVLTLTPPRPGQRAVAPPTATLSEQLVDAIVGAVKGVQTAREGQPPLELQSFETSLSFVVEKDTSGKGDFTIQPVTVSLGADFKDKAVQKLRLVFKAKK